MPQQCKQYIHTYLEAVCARELDSAVGLLDLTGVVWLD